MAVQPGRLGRGDEELGAVSVLARVGHRQGELFVFEGEVLIGKSVPVDGSAAGAVVLIKVAPLDHEAGDNSVEGRTGDSEPVLSGAKGSKILHGLGHDLFFENEVNFAQRFAVDGDVHRAKLPLIGLFLIVVVAFMTTCPQ